MKKYIGCSGYFYWAWKGKFYPEELKPSGWLNFYVKKFNTVEINSTFYRFPKKTNLKKWYRQTPEDFKFTVKVNKEITHLHRFKNTGDRLKEFYEVVGETLQEKLGTLLFQLPPGYKYSEENLERIISQIDPGFKNVIEFRNKGWWNEKVYNAFSEKGIIFCSISAPRLPDDIIKTSDTGYIRFHGKTGWYDYNYSGEELKEWSSIIKETNFKEVFIYFNNDHNAYAPYNALELVKIMSD